MNNEKLLKYKGWICNKLSINTIEYEFYPYKVQLCDAKEFNNNVHIRKTIRCLLIGNLINDLKFN